MNTLLKTVIVEDDLHAQEYLSLILARHLPEVEIIGYADSIRDSAKLINEKRPELVFMDVELTDGLSFEIFDKIDQYDFEVIFITGHDNYIQKAIDHYAFSFVVKPVVAEKIVEIVQRYMKLKERMFSLGKYQELNKYLQRDDSMLLIHVGTSHLSIEVDNIVKLVADGNYTIFHMENGKTHMASKSLKYYAELLTHKNFFKVNRSVLINVRFIKSIYKKETIILKNGDKLNVSVRNKPQMTALIKMLS